MYGPSSKIDRINKFSDLLEHLKIERDAREYGSVDDKRDRRKKLKIVTMENGCYLVTYYYLYYHLLIMNWGNAALSSEKYEKKVSLVKEVLELPTARTSVLRI